MLILNIQRVAEKCKAENLFQLSKIFNWVPYTVYKYSHPERVKALQITTLSQIVGEIAKHNKIRPEDVKIGDIFDWRKGTLK